MVLPFAVLAWESDLNLHGAIEQRYVTDLASHQWLTGAAASFGARAQTPLAAYRLSVSGGYFGAYPPAGGGSGSSGAHQVSGQLEGGATWQSSPRTQLSLRTHGRIASELGASPEDDPETLDAFAGNRLQYATGQDARFNAELSRRMTLSIGTAYSQTGSLAAPGPEPAGIDSHSAQSGFSTNFAATAVDELSAELGVRYRRYEQGIIDSALSRGSVDGYSGTVMLKEAHEFSQNLRASAGLGLTGVSVPVRPAGTSGVFPAGRLEMSYTKATYAASFGYALAYSSLGPRIGDGQSHAAWLRASASPLRGRVLRDFTVSGTGRLGYGIMPVGGQQASAGELRVWSASASIEMECPLVPRLALTSGLQLDLRHTVVTPAGPESLAPTSLRLTAIVGIGGLLWSDPSEQGRGAPK